MTLKNLDALVALDATGARVAWVASCASGLSADGGGRRAGARVLVTDSQGFARREFLEELHAAEGAAPGAFAFEVVDLDARACDEASGAVVVRRLVLEPA